MGSLLIIDDDPELLPEKVCHVFPPPAYQVETAFTGAEGLRRVTVAPPDVVLLNLRLPDQPGLEVLKKIRKIDARIPVVCVALARSADSAIEATKQGAYDYLLKPVDLQKLGHVVVEALNVARLMREPAIVAESHADDTLPGEALVGCCPSLQEVYKAIGRVAEQGFPVLITGESGTGKELVARAVYQHGPRAKAPFLALNCAAIPEQLLESELFGHEKGSFTGAERQRIGKFEQCDGGTLFLDEIGDMPLATQAKVLRVLEEQEFVRVGGDETIRTDVRLIAATHRDLKQWSDVGKFRADLYHRISVCAIELPPLRDRGEDLPILVHHYLRRFSPEMARDVVEVSAAAMDHLREYSWPGNIRELQNVLRQALLRVRGQILLPEFLPEFLQGAGRADAGGAAAPSVRGPDLETFIRRGLATGTSGLLTETHRWTERILLPIVLEYTKGNRRKAAEILGIARHTLRTRLREMGVTVQNLVNLGNEG